MYGRSEKDMEVAMCDVKLKRAKDTRAETKGEKASNFEKSRKNAKRYGRKMIAGTATQIEEMLLYAIAQIKTLEKTQKGENAD